MKQVLLIMAFGSVGAVCRYGIGAATKRWIGKGFPFDTLTANVLGCLLIGMLMYGAFSKQMDETVRTALVVGFLGSFTTFSAFGYATFGFMQKGAWGPALLNIGMNLILGLLAVWAGMTVARAAS